MSNLAGRIDNLQASFRTRVSETVDAALQGSVGQDTAWDSLLGVFGIVPLALEERLSIQQAGVPNMKGALPIEVRKALDAIRLQTEKELRPLRSELREASEAGGDTGAAEDKLSSFDYELKEFVAREMKKYVERARPQVTVGGIFANAMATTKRYEDPGEKINTKKCPCCGAARPADTDLTHCAFCGNELFKQV